MKSIITKSMLYPITATRGNVYTITRTWPPTLLTKLKSLRIIFSFLAKPQVPQRCQQRKTVTKRGCLYACVLWFFLLVS